MIRVFFASRKWALWAYGVGAVLLCSLYIQVHFSVLLNDWYGEFYNLLQNAKQHPVDEFWASMLKFLYIAMPYVMLATITSYVTRLYAFRWREAITWDYIPRWRMATEKIEGESQRIQEDAFSFAKIVESLGLQIVRAIMTLIAFIPKLAAMSPLVGIPFLQAIPYSLVWLALLLTVAMMGMSWLVGYFLPKLQYNNQKVEAAFRKELTLAEDDKENFASIPKLTELFTGIKFNYHRLYLHYGYFDVWSNFVGQLIVLVPYVLMGPGLFSGTIELGVLMMCANAFDKVQSSFAVINDNWTTVTELRSIHLRLKEFERNLKKFTPN